MPPGFLIATMLALLFGSMAVVLPPLKLMMAFTALWGALLICNKPLYGLLLFALLATAVPYTTITLGVRITLSEAVLALAWLGAWWQGFISGQPLLDRREATEKLLFWLMLFSFLPFLSGMLTIEAEGNALVNWLRWLLNLSLLYLIPLLLKTDQDRDRLIVMLLLGNLAMLLLSIGVFLKDRNALEMIPVLNDLKYAHPESIRDIFSSNPQRMASPWVHPNLTGGVLALFLPLALIYGLTREGWRRLLGASVFLLGSAGLLLSISRGAILALVLVLFWLALKRVPYSRRILFLGGVLALGMVLLYPPLQERLATMFSADNASTGIRLQEYREFPRAMARYPLGIGFKVEPPVPGSGLPGISNLWLNYIYKLGIPGMLLFIAVIIAWWREVRPGRRLPGLSRENGIWLGSVTGVLAALLTGLIDHYFSFTYVLVGLFWMLVGLSLQQVRLYPDLKVPKRLHKE